MSEDDEYSDFDEDVEESPGNAVIRRQSIMEQGFQRLQFFPYNFVVRVDRLPTSDVQNVAKPERDVKVVPRLTLFRRKADDKTHFLARITDFHNSDGTYDVLYIEELPDPCDQQARHIPSHNIHDKPVAFQEFVFAIILSVVNFVSDLYFIVFAAYKFEYLRWTMLGLLFLPVVNFIALDYGEFGSLKFVQFFREFATASNDEVWSFVSTNLGNQLTDQEVEERLKNVPSAGMFAKSLSSKYSWYSRRKSRSLLLLPLAYALDSFIFFCYRLSNLVHIVVFASFKLIDSSLSSLQRAISGLGWFSCIGHTELIMYGLVDKGRVVEIHEDDTATVRWNFQAGTLKDKKSKDYKKDYKWSNKVVEVRLNIELLEPTGKKYHHLEHEMDISARDIWKTVEQDAPQSPSDPENGATLSNEQAKIDAIEEAPKTSSDPENVSANEAALLPSPIDQLEEVQPVAAAPKTKSMIIVKRSFVKLKLVPAKTLSRLMCSNYLVGALSNERPWSEIFFVLRQHFLVMFYNTVFHADNWDSVNVFFPMIVSYCFFALSALTSLLGIGLLGFALSFLRVGMGFFKALSSFILYPGLHIFNAFCAVCLMVAAAFTSAATYLLCVLLTLILTVFCIHLKLFGFPIIGPALFAKKEDMTTIPIDVEAEDIEGGEGREAKPVDAANDTVEVSAEHAVVGESLSVLQSALNCKFFAIGGCADASQAEQSYEEAVMPVSAAPHTRYLVDDEHALDPSIKALNRALFAELLFESIPQMALSCVNVALTGSASSAAFIIAVASSSITFIYNVYPYGYYVFWNDRFTSQAWKEAEFPIFSLQRPIMFLSEINHRVNRTPRFNVADMDVFLTHDSDSDTNLYASLMMVVVSSVFLLFGLQCFFLDAHLGLTYSLFALFGASFLVALGLFAKSFKAIREMLASAEGPKKETKPLIDVKPLIMVMVASETWLFSLGFSVSLVLFFAYLDGYSLISTVSTAFLPIFLALIIHFLGTFALLLNDLVEIIIGVEQRSTDVFEGKILLFLIVSPILSLILGSFLALVMYKMDYPTESTWIPWRAAAAVLWGYLICGGAFRKVAIVGETANMLSTGFVAYFVHLPPFAIGFSMYAWVMDSDAQVVIPTYAYFLSQQLWTPLIALVCFGSGALIKFVIPNTGGGGGSFSQQQELWQIIYCLFVSWWQSMLLSFVADESYVQLNSFSLVMIPTFFAAFVTTAIQICSFSNVEFLTSEDAASIKSAFIKGAGALWSATSHFLFTWACFLSAILFFVNRDGYPGVATVLAAFAPIFIVAVIHFASATVLLVTDMIEYAMGTESDFKGSKTIVYFSFTYALWSLFFAAVAFKLDSPIESAWIAWGGLAGLLWGIIITGFCVNSVQLAGHSDFKIDEIGSVLVRLFASAVSPNAVYYFSFGVPFAVAFSAYSWSQDFGAVIPTFGYFLCAELWIPLSSFAPFVANDNWSGGDNPFEKVHGNVYGGEHMRNVSVLTTSVWSLFLSWWQLMLVSFIVDRSYSELTSYSLALIPTYMYLCTLSIIQAIEWFTLQIRKELPAHRYVPNVLGYEFSFSDIISTLWWVAAFPAISIAITPLAWIFLLFVSCYHLHLFANTFLYTLCFTISSILFFAYLDGNSSVPTCLGAFAPLLLDLIVAVFSGIVVGLRGFWNGRASVLNIYWTVSGTLCLLFVASVAYKLDDPVGSSWIQWRGLAALPWILCFMAYFFIFGLVKGTESCEYLPLTHSYILFGVPFAIGFSMFAWSMDVGEIFPTYSYFLAQQLLCVPSAGFLGVLIDDLHWGGQSNFEIINSVFLSWWQTMLFVFVYDHTYPELTSYSLALIPTYLSLFMSSSVHWNVHLEQGMKYYEEEVDSNFKF